MKKSLHLINYSNALILKSPATYIELLEIKQRNRAIRVNNVGGLSDTIRKNKHFRKQTKLRTDK